MERPGGDETAEVALARLRALRAEAATDREQARTARLAAIREAAQILERAKVEAAATSAAAVTRDEREELIERLRSIAAGLADVEAALRKRLSR